jgi:hypothetical protein
MYEDEPTIGVGTLPIERSPWTSGAPTARSGAIDPMATSAHSATTQQRP